MEESELDLEVDVGREVSVVGVEELANVLGSGVDIVGL